ncbi:transposase, partial [Accumulibacter sp.]|uniref:transposase n=1 Tax=Accumulibacter sp. TaxID=2053492 RepID=UPI002B822183
AWRRLLARRQRAHRRRRPSFALERWREIDAEHLIYESVKPGPGGRISLMLTPLERIERLAALIPPPRRHRHRYYGVLAPNAPLRAQVIALAGVQDSTPAAAATESIAATIAPSTTPSRAFEGTEEAPGEAEAIHRRAARCAWALLLARIDEVFPLVCPRCGGERRIIAFIIEASAVRDILTHLGEPTSPPRLMRARAPPLREMQGATTGEDDPQAQSAPEYEFDQRIAW